MKAKARTEALRSGRIRLALLPLCAAFLFLPSSQAFAEIIVDLDGSGTGTVTSNPVGIECSNVGGGAPGPDCSEAFPLETSPGSGEFLGVKLTPAPGPGSFFSGWSGDDPFGGLLGLGPTCNEGSASPCVVMDATEFGVPEIHITAIFKALPDPPIVTTEESGPGANQDLTTIEGSVNPSESKVSDCYFELGLTNEYGAKVPCEPKASELGEGTSEVQVSAEVELEQLVPDKIYHYRLVASNITGKTSGEDRTFTTGPAPADSCFNAEIRKTQALAAIRLPECMALEQVSPPKKGNQPVSDPTLSADGSRVSFKTVAGLGDSAGVPDPGGRLYVASRSSSGWTTTATSPRGETFFRTGAQNLAAGEFTPDFSRWFLIGSTQAQFGAGISQPFQVGLGSSPSPLAPPSVPLVPGDDPRRLVEETSFQGASSDHSHLYFVPGPGTDTSTAFLPGDPAPSGAETDRNTYVAHLDLDGQPSLELLARDRKGKIWGGNCGSRLGGIEPPPGAKSSQGAVSADGSRAYFSARVGQSVSEPCDTAANKLRILKRLETTQGIHIEELFGSECGRSSPACSSADGDDLYQGASIDGTKVYFTTNRQLVGSDLDGSTTECSRFAAVAGCDLYLYDSTLPAGQRLVQVSAGEEVSGEHEVGTGAALYAPVTLSADGSHAYFVAEGVLTGENAELNSPVAGQPNLYLYQRDEEHPDGRLAFIGVLDPGDGDILRSVGYPVPALGQDYEGHEVGGDGHLLLLTSKAPLTADDADGSHRDVFRYDASAEEIERISVVAPGGIDDGPFDVAFRPGFGTGTGFAETNRWTSEDGQTVVFTTPEGLLPGDVNGAGDSYLWREGALFRLPGTILSSLPVVSHDGDDVAFTSFSQLLPPDGDSNIDVYVVRASGGFTEPVETEPCQPDAGLPGRPCVGTTEPAPTPPSAVSADFQGTGNPNPTPRSCPKGKRRVRREGKVRCRRPNRRPSKRGRASSTRDASTDRRAAK